jgi:hypothetical protein
VGAAHRGEMERGATGVAHARGVETGSEGHNIMMIHFLTNVSILLVRRLHLR